MRKEIFQDCIQSLEMLSPRALPERAIEVIYNRLNENRIGDEDLKSGVSELIDNYHFRSFPALAEILDACRKARGERFQREHERSRREEDRYRDVDQKALMERGLKGSPVVQALIKNAMDLLDEKIDLETWAATQRMVIGEIKGADPENINLMCAALWKLEKRIEGKALSGGR